MASQLCLAGLRQLGFSAVSGRSETAGLPGCVKHVCSAAGRSGRLSFSVVGRFGQLGLAACRSRKLGFSVAGRSEQLVFSVADRSGQLGFPALLFRWAG